MVNPLPLLGRKRSRTTGAKLTPRAKPCFETLESRDCPSINLPPSLQNVEVIEHSMNLIEIRGQVSDEYPDSTTVSLSGLVTGSLSTNALGEFSEAFTVNQEGTIAVVATDDQNQTSDTVQVVFDSDAPVIQNLSYDWTSNPKEVTITGTVVDEHPDNLEVTITGAGAGTAYTNSQGNFSITLELSQLGDLNFSVSDQWDQSNPAASLTITNDQPVITCFTVTVNAGGTITLSGSVSDEQATGQLVTFTMEGDGTGELGSPGFGTLLGNAEVDENGNFSLTIPDPYTSGAIYADFTDVWDSVAETKTAYR